MSKIIKITNFHPTCDSTLAVERGAALTKTYFGKTLNVVRADNSDDDIATANMVFTDRKVNVDFFSQISASQTVNRIANLDSMTLKVPLSKTIRAYDQYLYELQAKPFSWGLWATSIAPETFVWPDEKNLMQFHIDNKSSPFGSDCEYFICKPNDGCQGQGIKIVQGMENVLTTLDTVASQIDQSPFDGTYVVQPYKSSPALYHGLKFDMRVYVVMVGDGCAINNQGEYLPCRAFLLRSGFARLCSVPYEKVNAANASTETMHIANDGINFKNGVKMSEILRTIEHVFETVSTENEKSSRVDCGNFPVSTDHFWKQLEDLSGKVICSFQHSLREKHRIANITAPTPTAALCLECCSPVMMKEPRGSVVSSGCDCNGCVVGSGGTQDAHLPLAEVPTMEPKALVAPPDHIHSRSYQLLGLDVMLDANGKMWLLECNAKPCMDWEKEQVEYTVGPEVNSEVMAISLAIGSSLNDAEGLESLLSLDMIKTRTIELDTSIQMARLADSLLIVNDDVLRL